MKGLLQYSTGQFQNFLEAYLLRPLIQNDKGDQKLADASKNVTEEVVIGFRSRKPVIICFHA